jgi:predicted dehydrogenase
MGSRIKIAVVGYGYWGPNLMRNFTISPHFDVIALAEPNAERRAQAGACYPDVRLFETAEELIAASDCEAVAIASPVATHYRLTRLALQRGLHVLVEKPLASTVAEAEELVGRADRLGLTLLVDHTFLFTGAAQAIRKLYHDGELGRISYYDSMRVNLGLFQPDVNVLWDLAPHDLSIMDYILEEEPVYIEASGYCHVNPEVPDIVYLTLHFASDAVAHFNLSWMSPVKVRRIAIGGLKRMLVWDDLNHEEKIKIYNSGIDFHRSDERRIVLPEYRIGDIYSPRVSGREALSCVVEHFYQVIAGKEAPIIGADRGLRVLRMLEQAQNELDRSLHTARNFKREHEGRTASPVSQAL